MIPSCCNRRNTRSKTPFLGYWHTGTSGRKNDNFQFVVLIHGHFQLLSQYGPFLAIIAGIALAGILASTMSTADSQLLTAASGVSQDLLQDFFGIKLSPKSSMLAARGTVIGIAIVEPCLQRWAAGSILMWRPSRRRL